MKLKIYLLIALMVNVVVFAYGDDEIPNASPSMTIFANDSMQVTDSYEGSAPVKATFNSNASDYGGYTPIYEWRFFNSENSETPFLVRYDANTEYTFNESGSFTIQLCISFVNGEDTVEYLQESPFTISISTSKLEIPNAFSPNGDDAKDGVYYVIIKARGADGRNYNLRRDVNLLRGYESSDSGNNQ